VLEGKRKHLEGKEEGVVGAGCKGSIERIQFVDERGNLLLRQSIIFRIMLSKLQSKCIYDNNDSPLKDPLSPAEILLG